jgi:hypothetical protein
MLPLLRPFTFYLFLLHLFLLFTFLLYHSSYCAVTLLEFPLTPHPVPPVDGKRGAVRNEKANST